MASDKNTLKSFFKKGQIPTEANFSELISSMLNAADDGIDRHSPESALRIRSGSSDEGLLDFHKTETDGSQSSLWRIGNRSGSSEGFGIGKNQNHPNLFIDGATGKIGIGTSVPTEQLSIGDFSSGDTYIKIGTVGGNTKRAGIKLRHYSDSNGWTIASDERPKRLGLHFINETKKGGESALFINKNNLVGIGENLAPANKLDVAQAARTGTHRSGAPLYVTGEMKQSQGVEFRHSNGTQGIGFGHNTIYATGSNANQDLNLQARGTGKINILGALEAKNAITPLVGKWSHCGIVFPKDPWGGSGDNAWIRYYTRAQGKEDTKARESATLEIGIANDGDDHIALMSSGNVGIGTNSPKAKLHIAGTTVISQQASNDRAKRELDSLGNNVLILGGVSHRWVYFYWKDNNGVKLRATITGSAF